MQGIVFNIFSEKSLDRMEELREYLRNFPESALAPAMRNELEYLEYLGDHGACPGGYQAFRDMKQKRGGNV